VLKQIGRTTHSNAVCGNLVVHANGAIDSALHDDVLVGRVVARLRDIDLENNALSKRGGLSELNRLAGELNDESLRGESEIKRLREAAERKGGPGLNSGLRTFSDALGGALGRQHRIGIDLSNFLAYLDYRDMREMSRPTDSPQRRGIGTDPFSSNGFPSASAPTPQPGTPYSIAGTPNRMAVAAAVDFEARNADVRGDEARAAEHSEAAVSGCT
jgi:hypothetical protein